jgi:hypothetical protein
MRRIQMTPTPALTMYYRINVTLKNGNQATGRELYEGSVPASGTELEVPLMRGVWSKRGSARQQKPSA